MIQRTLVVFVAVFAFLAPFVARAEKLEDLFRKGEYLAIVDAWDIADEPDANTAGLTYFAAYYASSATVLEQSAARFKEARDASDPDLLGIGLGDLRELHNDMRMATFSQGDEYNQIIERVFAQAARLKVHPVAEVAAYAAFYEAFVASFSGQMAHATELVSTAKREHADLLAANNDWRLMALQIELVVASESGDFDVATDVLENFSFDQLTGSPFEFGVIESMASGLMLGEDVDIARQFMTEFIEFVKRQPDPSTRYWRAYNQTYGVDRSPHDFSDLAEELYAIAGENAALADDISTQDVYFASRYEIRGVSPSYIKAFLTPVLAHESFVAADDPYLGRLLTLLSEAEEDLGNENEARELAIRAVAQPAAPEAAKLLKEAEPLSPRDAFLLLKGDTTRIHMDADLAGYFAVLKRLYELSLTVDDVEVRDRSVMVSLYAGMLARLGKEAESDRAYAAFIDQMLELERTNAEAAHLAYLSYQDHLRDIGKFSKSASIERDIDRSFARRGLQDLSASILGENDESLNYRAVESAAQYQLDVDIRSLAELAENRIENAKPERAIEMAAVAIAANLYLDNSGSIPGLIDRAVAHLISTDDRLPSLWDLQLALGDAMPEIDIAIDSVSDLARDARATARDYEQSKSQYCPALTMLPLSANLLGCNGTEPELAKPADIPDSDNSNDELVETETKVADLEELMALQAAVAAAPIGEMLEPLLIFRDALVRSVPENMVALAEVDAGLAIAYDANKDPRAHEYAESAFETFVSNGLLTVSHLYSVFESLPGSGADRVARIEKVRPSFQAFPFSEPVEAWLDLNLGCATVSDETVPVAQVARYIARAFATPELWKRDIPGCDPFSRALASLQLRVEVSPTSAVAEAAEDLHSIADWVTEITLPESDASLNAVKIDILAARAIGDTSRAEAGLATLLTEPYRSHPLQSYFVRDLEDRNEALEQGAATLNALFETQTELPILNELIWDIANVIRPLIGSMAADELRLWIDKHASIHFDEVGFERPTATWRLGARDPEQLGVWALEVAERCTGMLSDPYLQDQPACAELALSLAEDSLKDRAAGRSIERDPLDIAGGTVFISDDVLDPGRFAARMRRFLEDEVVPSRLAHLDQLAVDVLAEAEPRWTSTLASNSTTDTYISEWLKDDEAVILFTLDRATVIRKGHVRHVLIDVPVLPLVTNTRSMRASMQQTGVGEFKAVRIRSAWSLWQTLFAPIEDQLGGIEHMWIQAPPIIQQVPFEALVMREPTERDWKVGDLDPGWLIERFSVSVVSSIGSLRGLRAAAPSEGSKALLGLGAPELKGDGRDLRTIETLMTDGRIDPQKVSGLKRLGAAKEELAQLSQLVGATNSTLVTGPAMTHANLADIRWSDYRSVVFATHGLVASNSSTDVRALLVLSPGEADDPVHLEPADIGRYQLDADLVILAACNTGIVDDLNADFGLSVFADTFIDNGVRAVVVSKWPLVSSDAWRFSVPLMGPTAPGQVARTLRDVRMELIQSGDPVLAHPAFWSSLTVVGDVPNSG